MTASLQPDMNEEHSKMEQIFAPSLLCWCVKFGSIVWRSELILLELCTKEMGGGKRGKKGCVNPCWLWSHKQVASEKNLTTIWTFRSVKSSENDMQSCKDWHKKKKKKTRYGWMRSTDRGLQSVIQKLRFWVHEKNAIWKKVYKLN